MTWWNWPWRLARFWSWFAKEIIVSNATVLRDNLTPGQDSTPGIARFDTRCRTDHELTLLASLITLTPGTLTLGTTITGDGRDQPIARVLFVHGMYHDGPDELRADLTDMETRMLTAIRPRGPRP